jgi:uncharacterized protein YjbI with pentapeptide repeats
LQASGSQVSGSQVSGSQVSGSQVSGLQVSGLQVSGSQVSGSQVSGSQVSVLQASGLQVSGLQVSFILNSPHYRKANLNTVVFTSVVDFCGKLNFTCKPIQNVEFHLSNSICVSSCRYIYTAPNCLSTGFSL